jgi:hypothetical protein
MRRVMRRLALTSVLLATATAACTTSVPAGPPPASTVRDLLATEGASLAITSDSAGSLIARFWEDGWEDQPVDLGIGGGALVVSLDHVGRLIVEDLDVALAPLELSDDVFDEPARLVDLRAELAMTTPIAPITWTDPDTGSATMEITLRLWWSIERDGEVTPLGSITLRDLPIDVSIAGSAAAVDATVSLHTEGTLWSFASLIELADLSLALTARSE